MQHVAGQLIGTSSVSAGAVEPVMLGLPEMRDDPGDRHTRRRVQQGAIGQFDRQAVHLSMHCCSLSIQEPGQHPTLVGGTVGKDTLHVR